MDAKRIAWIDNAKAIGIFLVVLGHLPVPEYLATYIYSFHMPLFFFLSGLVFKGRESTVLAFARTRSRTLLIPYVVFGVLTYLFWVLIARNVGQDIGTGIPWYQPLVGMLYSNGIDDWLIHNVPIWFLTCLLLTELCFYLLSRVAHGYLQLLAALVTVATIGYCASYLDLPRFPWGINLITETLVFFGAGYLVGSGFRDGHLSIRSGVLLVLGILGVHLVLAFWNGRVDMNWNNQGNFLLFYLAAFSGISGWLLMARMMPASRIVAYVGQNTLTILCYTVWHSPC